MGDEEESSDKLRGGYERVCEKRQGARGEGGDGEGGKGRARGGEGESGEVGGVEMGGSLRRGVGEELLLQPLQHGDAMGEAAGLLGEWHETGAALTLMHG